MRLNTCSVCGGRVDYNMRSGKALPHNEWRMGKAGPFQTDRLCEGAGRLTEERAW